MLNIDCYTAGITNTIIVSGGESALYTLGGHTVLQTDPIAVVAPLGLWGVMAVVAVVNGVLRETYIVPRTGSQTGHLISTALLVLAILVLVGLFFSRTTIPYSLADRIVIGVGWTVLTVGFDFLVGYLEGTPMSVTLEQYNVLAGQVWIAVPLTLLLAPVLFGSA